MMSLPSLISAIKLTIPMLGRLVDSYAADSVRTELLELLARHDAGEDVDFLLLDLIAKHAGLRRSIRELIRTEPVLRGTESEAIAIAAKNDTDEQPLARFVNTLVVEQGGLSPVSHGLLQGHSYEVLVNIGKHVAQSLLGGEEGRWPEDLLDKSGVWLRAVLTVEGVTDPAVAAMFLPPSGDSFTCQCGTGSVHMADCARDSWARLPISADLSNAGLRAEVVIYYEVTAIHAQAISLPIGPEADPPTSQLIGRLTRTFGALDNLAGRVASIVPTPGNRVVVNGVGFADSPFAITAGASDTALLNTRSVLYYAHFREKNGLEYSNFDSNFSKDYTAFEADLRLLAKAGAQAYTRIFTPSNGDMTAAFSIPDLLRHEAYIRNRPPTIEILDDRFDENRMLWATVYDMPVGDDQSNYAACPSLQQLHAGDLDPESLPALCPYDAQHRDAYNVLCPWGFWGLAAMVEQPASVVRDPGFVVAQAQEPIACLVAVGDDLDAPVRAAHLDALRGMLGAGSVDVPDIPSDLALAAKLAPEGSDIVYFYCHCGYESISPEAGINRYLLLQGYRIGPQDVSGWARAKSIWPRPHWPSRRPIVVLNGCHTVEATSGTLNSFAPVLIQYAGASGVIGTEVRLEQELAAWAGEKILTELSEGRTVGDAMRQLRWQLLARGNVMGFAYTPYCLSNLALRNS